MKHQQYAICRTAIFDHLTEGGEYLLLDGYKDSLTDEDLYIIENNAKEQRAYHSSWFY